MENIPLIAVVDDEKTIRDTVSCALKGEGYRVLSYNNGQEAWEAFASEKPHLFILDIMMPIMDGLTLLRKIRTVSEEIPVIFLTSRDDEFDKVLGLEVGADDYLCKPFSLRELLARVKVLFKRCRMAAVPVNLSNELILDEEGFTASLKGQLLNFTVTEFRILHSLYKDRGRVKTRENLLRAAYPYDVYVTDRTIDTHIKRIRKKISTVLEDFDDIETIYGLGYKFRESSL